MILASMAASAYPPTRDRSASAGIWSTRERTASEVGIAGRETISKPGKLDDPFPLFSSIVLLTVSTLGAVNNIFLAIQPTTGATACM